MLAAGGWAGFPLAPYGALAANAGRARIGRNVPGFSVGPLSALVKAACEGRMQSFNAIKVFKVGCDGRKRQSCTLAGPTALLQDGVRTGCKGAGVALAADGAVAANARPAAVRGVVEMLAVCVCPMFKHTVGRRSWKNIGVGRKIQMENI